MIKAILFKNSNCSLCKLMLHELMDNPPNCDVEVAHIKEADSANDGRLTKLNVKTYPCTILFDGNKEIYRFEGYVTSEIINLNIKDYERKIGL